MIAAVVGKLTGETITAPPDLAPKHLFFFKPRARTCSFQRPFPSATIVFQAYPLRGKTRYRRDGLLERSNKAFRPFAGGVILSVGCVIRIQLLKRFLVIEPGEEA